MIKKLSAFLYVTFFSILLIFFYLLIIERDPQKIPSALLNKKIPIFKTSSLIKNESFISSQKIGNKITLINFFASWCKPCREEHIFIKRLSDEQNIKVIGINYKDNSKNALEWLEELGNPYSSVAIDKNGKIAIEWGVYGIPETFIVNSNSIIKYKHVGPVNNKIYHEIISVIKNNE